MGDAFYRQKDKLLEIRQTLKSVIDGYKEDPDKIAELLEFKSRFWNYSLNNSILILSQNSAATFVASYRGWQQKGYHVRKGQHGIKVLYPIRIELIPLGIKDGKQQYRRVSHATPEEKAQIAAGKLKTVTYTRFGVGTVFDISQTDCPPEDYPRFYSMGYSSKQHAELYQAVKQFAESKGVPVKETDLHSISLRGAFYPKENVIRISDKLNDTERLSTLTHELGHALMHSSKDALKLPTPVAELEADAISIMLQKHFGIDLTDSRKRHLTDNYRACAKLKDFDLTAVLKAVNKAYYGLRKEMDPVLENPDQKMPEKKQALERYDPEDNQYRVRSHTQITKFAQQYYPADTDFFEDCIYKGYDPNASLSGIDQDVLDDHSPDVELVVNEIKYALGKGINLELILNKNYSPEQMHVIINATEHGKKIPECLRALSPYQEDSFMDRVILASQDFALSQKVDEELRKVPKCLQKDKALISMLFTKCDLQNAADFYSRMISYEKDPPNDSNPDQYDWNVYWKDHIEEAHSRLEETKEQLLPVEQKLSQFLQAAQNTQFKENIGKGNGSICEKPVNTASQQPKKKMVPPYNHFYFENKYLFTVTGDKEAQEVYDYLTNEASHMGYFWSDSGVCHISDHKEAPVSDLAGADKTKTAYIPYTQARLQKHIKYLEKIYSEADIAIASDSQKMPLPRHPAAPRQYDNEKSGDVLDYIKQDVSLLTVAKDMGFTPVKTGGYYSLKEHDSIRIYPETNSYYQFSAGTGGSPIDFVMHLGGYSKEEAIRRLKEQYVGNRLDSLPPVKEKNPPEPKKKEFILPDKAQGKYRHAFAYLVKTRCIDSAIVGQCIKEGLIYEDNKHNVVFVGKDETGKAAFATRHTSMTGSSFKRDVAGSRQDLGWMVKSPKARKLYVCEAPIDALSIMTLMKQQGKAVENASYLATCGTCKDSAVYTRLRENPQTQVVVLANDNDFAGRKANQKIYENLQKKYPKIRVRLLNPKRGKDINECLCHISTPKERIQDEEVER